MLGPMYARVICDGASLQVAFKTWGISLLNKHTNAGLYNLGRKQVQQTCVAPTSSKFIRRPIGPTVVSDSERATGAMRFSLHLWISLPSLHSIWNMIPWEQKIQIFKIKHILVWYCCHSTMLYFLHTEMILFLLITDTPLWKLWDKHVISTMSNCYFDMFVTRE